MRRLADKRLEPVLLLLVLLGCGAVLIVALASPDLMGRLLRGTAGGRGTVDIAAFSGWAEQGTAQLQWRTASEANLLGFNLYRSEDGVAPYVLLNPEPIPSQAMNSGSATYSFVDGQVAEGETYFYKLEPLDSQGRLGEHGPISVQILPISSMPPAMQHRVFLPVVFMIH